MSESKVFQSIWAENPRWHDRAPYALRRGASRPTGSYETIAEAVAAGRIGEYVVTTDGWWIQGWVKDRCHWMNGGFQVCTLPLGHEGEHVATKREP